MANKRIQRLKGTTAAIAAMTPLLSEYITNTDNFRIHVGDGSTAGGHPLALLSDLTAGLNTKANSSHAHSPSQVGLGNVANKTEAQMVASGAIADALGGKVSKSGDTMTGALIAPGVETTNGSMTIKNDGYSHLWFRNAAGTEKAVIFCNNAGENATFRVNGTQHFNFQANGSFVAPQNLAAYSDARLKSEVETICDALAIIKNLRGARYIKGGVKQIGLIAQEVRVVVPEAVFENTDEDDPFLKAGHKTGTLSVAADNTLLAVVIEAVKELAAEVKVLKERLK